MNYQVHPELHSVTAHCTGCGANFPTESTMKDIRVGLCSQCHPFFTGEQKFVDTAGRVEQFKRKYASRYKNKKSE